MKLTLITIAGVLLLCVGAKAQTAQDLTPSHLQTAEKYLIATGINTKFGAITDNIINAFSGQIPENQRQAFVGVMKKFMDKYYTWDTLKSKLDKLYAAEFTEDELNQLIVFVNTPLGKKYVEKSVTLSQKGMLLGQEVVKDHQDELEQMMKEAMAGTKN
ncbi:MAG: DUF2059 domain-containing protein [Mucilaginibacter sp.]